MKLTPSGEACGARVTDIDLSRPLDAATVADIRALWLDHQVLSFPGQTLSAQGSIKAQAPQSLSVTFENLYSPYQISGVVLALLLALGLVVFIFFIREMSSRRPAGKKR